MISLRRRLTISYTVLVGGFIALVAIVLTWLAVEAVIEPIKSAIASYARDARDIVAKEPYLSADALMARLRSVADRPDIVIFKNERPGIFAQRIGPPGAFGNGPSGAPPEGRFGPPPGDSFGGAGSGPRFDLTGMVGLRPAFIRLGTAAIVITADRPRLEARVRLYLMTLFGALILAFVAAWLIARWIAAQAVEPLIAVTAELRRFANGDFTPSAVPRGNVTDVGALIEAYNGAAAQVSSAFEERGRAEDRMRRFLADAGHELRTPLSIVTAYVEVLRKGGADDPRVRERAFSTLGAETTRMRRLVERLVALARLESPETTQPVVVDLGALAGDAVAAIVAARGVDNIQCDAESGAFVLADPGDLHEAITNLVDNAIKYGDESLVRVTVRHEQGAVSVRVSDCGPGIAEADREKIFERFYRSAEQLTSAGSGLGLAISKRAAARAGGELALEKTGERETIFRLRLPLYTAGPIGEVAVACKSEAAGCVILGSHGLSPRDHHRGTPDLAQGCEKGRPR